MNAEILLVSFTSNTNEDKDQRLKESSLPKNF